MLLAVADVLWAALTVLLLLVGALVALAVTIGVPAGVGRLVYDRAQVEELANPVALGFGAAFFAALVELFVFGVMLFYYG